MTSLVHNTCTYWNMKKQNCKQDSWSKEYWAVTTNSHHGHRRFSQNNNKLLIAQIIPVQHQQYKMHKRFCPFLVKLWRWAHNVRIIFRNMLIVTVLEISQNTCPFCFFMQFTEFSILRPFPVQFSLSGHCSLPYFTWCHGFAGYYSVTCFLHPAHVLMCYNSRKTLHLHILFAAYYHSWCWTSLFQNYKSRGDKSRRIFPEQQCRRLQFIFERLCCRL